MKLFLAFLAALLLSIGVAWAPPLMTGLPFGGGVGWNGIYTLSYTATTSFTYATGITNGTAIGTATTAIAPQPLTAVTYSLTGTSAADFTINSSTGVIAANGSTPTCTSSTPYSLNVVATESGVSNSPVTQPITITCQSPGTPIMFQHVASSTNPAGNGIAGHAFVIPIEPVPANSVAVMFVSAPVGKTVTISDTLVGSWSAQQCSASGGAGNSQAWAFVQPLGASGGADTITIGVGASNTQPVQYDLTIWENINTTTPANGSHCSATNGVTPSGGVITDTGSFTPGNNDTLGGNVIETYVPVCGLLAGSNTTAWTAASGYTLLNSEIIWTNNQGFPNAVEWKTQTSAASITAAISETGDSTDCFNMATVALATLGNGSSAPSAIHVAKIIHESMTATGATVTTQQSWTGTLRIATFTWTGGCPGGGGSCLTSVTSGDACSWTLLGGTHGGSVIGYAQNCSTETSDTLVLHLSGAIGAQFSFRVYDVTGALASSFQNATTDTSAACGTTWTNLPGSFTPSGASSGLAIHALGNGNGPVPTITSPTGTTPDQWQFTGITDSDIADNSDDSDHLYYSGSPTLSWNGTKTNGADTCYYMSAAFN